MRNSKLRVRGAHSQGIDTDRSPPPDLLFGFELSFGLKAENTAFTRGKGVKAERGQRGSNVEGEGGRGERVVHVHYWNATRD